MKHADPARMSVAERLAEIADLLARGVQRLLADEDKAHPEATNAIAAPNSTNSQNHLAVLRAVEAPCRSRARSPQSQEYTA